jgi:hypothetical protein
MDFRPIIKVENENKQLQAKIKALESKRHQVVKTNKVNKPNLVGEKPFLPTSKEYGLVEPLIYQQEELEQIRKATLMETMKLKEEKELFECSFQPQINEKSKEIVRTSPNYVPILERAEYDVETIRKINEKQEEYVEINRLVSKTVSVKGELADKRSLSRSQDINRTVSVNEGSVSKSKATKIENSNKVSVNKEESKPTDSKKERGTSRERSQSKDKNQHKQKSTSRSKSPSRADGKGRDKNPSKNKANSRSKSRDKSASKNSKTKERSSSKSNLKTSSKVGERKDTASKSPGKAKTHSVSSPTKLKKVVFAQKA